jgi:CheY-like chemotaxis protein
MNTVAQDTSKAGTSTTVLIVDDDSFSQKLFTAILAKLGVSDVHTANNGRVGLRTLAHLPRPPDVLICDVFMPDMDGIEFLAELSKTGFQGGIVLVSGQDISIMDIAQQVALANGLQVLGAYTKPVPPEILAESLARLQLPTAPPGL